MLDRKLVPLLIAVSAGLAGCSLEPRQPEFAGTPPVPPARLEPSVAHSFDEAKQPHTREIVGSDRYPCAGHAICATSSPTDGTLKLAASVPKSIDPCFATDTAGQLAVDNLFEGLFVPGGVTREPQPGVAESYELSDDKRVYTFRLRAEARWSNGDQVRAEDFRYAWMRVLDPATASSNASAFFTIKGARKFNSGQSIDPASVGITVLDPRTLVVTLENPAPDFLRHVSQVQFAPVPRSVVGKHGPAWVRPENIVSNGAYVLAEWKHRVRFVLRKNPHYWSANTVQIPRVLVHLGGDQAASITRYRQTQQHVVMDVPSKLIPTFLEAARPDFFVADTVCYVDLIFNVQASPFDELRVRQAFARAIDKERYVEHLLGGVQRVADGPVPPIFKHSHGFPLQPGMSFDPEAAQNLLEKAGFPNGLGLPSITLLHSTSEQHVRSATFVQANLKRHLNVQITLQQMENKTLLKRLHSHDFHFARYARCHPKDPYLFLEEFSSDSTHNHYNYREESFDRVLKQSRQTENELARMRLMGSAAQQIQREVPHIPLYTGTRSYLKVPVLRGWSPESGNRQLVKYMYWGDKETKTP